MPIYTTATFVALAVPFAVGVAQGNAQGGRQDGGPTACSIINTDELKRITGLKDVLKTGPLPTDPSELPKGRTECEYLGLTFSVSSLTTPKQYFDQTRASLTRGGTKVETAPDVGDDAFYWWDPKPGTLRQLGIAVRAGNRQLTVLDLTSSDSIAAVKPRLLAIAKALAPKLR
jgi:hypothetical protein